MNWTNDMTREFLELYEKHPVLWFPGHKEHKNRNMLACAWVEIQQEFGVDIPISILRRKKESIMATYRFLRRKIKKEKESGRTYRPNWYLYRLVDRIMKKVRFNDLLLNDDTAENVEGEDYDDGGEWSALDKDVKPLNLKGTVLEVDEIDEDEELSSNPLELQFLNRKSVKGRSKTTGPQRKKLRNRINSNVIIETDDTNLDSYELPEQIFSQSSASESLDSCSMYCQLLAEKLRSLSSRNRMIVQNKIDNLVFDALMEEMGVPSSKEKSSSASVKESDAEDNRQNEITDFDSGAIVIKSSINSVTDMEDQIDSNIRTATQDSENSDIMGDEY